MDLIESLSKNKLQVFVVSFLGLVSLALLILNVLITNNFPTTSATLGTKTVQIGKLQSFAPPSLFQIPKLHIKSSIQYIGLTPEGAMDVPNNSTDVGWYKLGPNPGNRGNSVITGHLNTANGVPGVFANLKMLSPGDEINIVDQEGSLITFRVTKSQIYNPDEDDSEVFGPSNTSHLILITCDGDWDIKKNSYTQRLVVFTDLDT